jgi:hypothetical protein
MRKIYLRVEGGLGNQMFQYAFARAIQKEYGGTIIFDLHTYEKDKLRSISLSNFYLNEDVVIKASLRNRLVQKGMRMILRILNITFNLFKITGDNRIKKTVSFGFFDQIHTSYDFYMHPCRTNNLYIKGNWMSERFFLSVKDIIKEEFKLKTPNSKKNNEFLSAISSFESVCVHIRRGDYTNSTWSSRLLVCGFEYYNKALNKMKEAVENPIFYVFSNSSDDLEWIKANYKFSVDVLYVDLGNSDFEELFLMSKFKNFIISNSSFSWWASYLANNEDKVVIAPSKWNNGVWEMDDIYLDEWELIKI